MAFHKLTVAEVRELTPDSKEIVFTIPSGIQSSFKKSAGQFISLKLNINGEEVRRDYSICTAEEKEESIGVGVKRVEKGLASNYLNDQIKAGDVIEVSEPQGRFTLNNEAKEIVLIAAGSGITPNLALLKKGLKDTNTEKVQLLYTSKSAKDCMFLNEIIALADAHPNKLQVTFFFTRDYSESGGGNNVTYREGRLHESFVQGQVESQNFSQRAEYFICGPEDLILRMQKFLKKNFVQEGNIHFELFTSIIKKTEAPAVSTGNSHITILEDGEESSFEMSNSGYILDAAIEADLDPPYSCQGGVCGACVCTLTEGEVEMEDNFTLMENEIAEGKILVCISKPKSAVIKLEYED